VTREEAINKAIDIVFYFQMNFAKSKEAREEAERIIEALEQDSYECRKGRWTKNDWNELICPFCGWIDSEADMLDTPSNFCPNCGADMRE